MAEVSEKKYKHWSTYTITSILYQGQVSVSILAHNEANGQGEKGRVWLAATSRDKQTHEDGWAAQQLGLKWKDELNGCPITGHRSEHESCSSSTCPFQLCQRRGLPAL